MSSGQSGFLQQAEWPKTDFTNSVVDLDEIMSGGVPKDGIPAIDKPMFTSQEEASQWLSPREPVIVLEIDGQAKAYPLQILTWHEIVNDALADLPVAVTFCPLCNASIVFDRTVAGEVLDFGTTGRLRKSDLVMYDRQTETWWQQITGKGLIGDYAGVKLDKLPAQIVSFESFREAYPASQVLSRNTGFSRMYGRNPYRGYDDIDNTPFLLNDPTDPRLPPMERVVNVSIRGEHRVYPFRTFDTEPVINDTFEDVELVVFSKNNTVSVLDRGSIAESRTIPAATVFSRNVDGQTLTFERHDDGFYDLETNSRWNIFGHAIEGDLAGAQLQNVPNGIHFAFAWLAFHPESQIYSR